VATVLTNKQERNLKLLFDPASVLPDSHRLSRRDQEDGQALLDEVGRLRAENARFKAGLEMVSQIVHGSTRTTRRIAETVLGGADPDDARFVDAFR
jgi:hypothetical protein